MRPTGRALAPPLVRCRPDAWFANAYAVTRAELEAVARAWMAFWQGMGQGTDLAGFAALHAPDFVDHAAAGRAADRAGFTAGVAALYAAFPDFRAAIDALTIDERTATVAIRWRATGTHCGPFMGHAPTGARVSFAGIEVIAVRGGVVTARWGEWNGTEIDAQLRAAAGLLGADVARG